VAVEGQGYAVAYAIADDNLRTGHTVIADCVNPWTLTRRKWRGVAERCGVPALDIEVVCSDTHEHRHRVESRTSDLIGHQLPTWQEVLGRDYAPWEEGDRVVVDTARLNVLECIRVIRVAIVTRRLGGR
jgi:predicted kinase